ncbi:MAG: amidase [Planctomycetales bacterium]|nr:amidase [Planctomycetales bacterium]
MARWNRRHVLQALSGLGIFASLGNVFNRALADEVSRSGKITPEMIAQAEWVAGLSLSPEQRDELTGAAQSLQQKFALLRAERLDASEPPVLAFFPAAPNHPGAGADADRRVTNTSACPERPETDDELAFLPVSELGQLIRARKVTSVELTKIYLRRLRQFDPMLKCVVTLTESLALEQAERADQELSDGKDRGPLHGIPWGAKDLIAYPGFPTTWGAAPFRDQMLSDRATVAERLDAAGAVLVAKLSLGALAWGDRWFGGLTRNPWNTGQGSSGSSAGSAAATAAGLVGFALGSETLGSIVSPCRRCSVTGLRPTFGRVSRWGCMPLAWSMDKIGPIARGVEDCALVLAAIHGADGRDHSAVTRPFAWPGQRAAPTLRIGYVEDGRALEDRDELRIFREIGATLTPIQLPQDPPAHALHPILNVEAASVFDDLTRTGVEEGLYRWPAAFREGQFTPAVEYLRAQRFRGRLIERMNEMFDAANIDLYVDGQDLVITNFTGHPTVVLRKAAGAGDAEAANGGVTPQPEMFTLTGRLFGESALLTAAHAYEQHTKLHRLRPTLRNA